MKEPKVVAIPTQDVTESMRVLISTGRFERFGESDDVLVDKQSGDYVYLVTFEAYQRLMRRIREKDASQWQVGVVAVPCAEEARRVLLESGRFDVCPNSDNAVIDSENGVQVSLVPFSGKN